MPTSLFSALVADRPEARRFLPARFEEAETWAEAARRAGARAVPAALREELAVQSRALPASPARERRLEELASPGATVIVTGQQAGLFGGPLYAFHKAATAIARARLVTERTGRPAIPIFWVQSEDHDFAEIAQVDVLLPSGRRTFALPPDAASTRVSVAHRDLPDDVTGLVAELRVALEPLPHGADVAALLERHYVPGRSIVRAFAGLMAEFWADEGLVVFDPRVEAVARLAAPLFERVLADQDAVARALGERCDALREAGFEVQVPPRPEASLVFHHPRGVTGPRYRLVRRSGGFETPEGAVTLAELGALLAREPLRFSTSSLLRPLLQDSLFPTAAYVGGPAEVSYFGELPPLYELLSVPFPLVAPRARLRLLDATTRSLLDRLGIAARDVEASRESLLARTARRGDAPSTTELEAGLLGPLSSKLDELEALGLHDLAAPIRRTRDACADAVKKLAGKVERTLLERDRVAVDRVDRALSMLHPDGTPQERAYGFCAFAARSGTRAFAQALLAAAEPLDPAVKDVAL